MEFHNAYAQFIERRKQAYDSRAAERIQHGVQHAELTFLEQVWWPAFQSFDGLYPEYEVRDFKDGHRYIDFAFIQPHYRIAIEIDGIGPHWNDISQEKFSDHCHRQNHLVIDGWHVLRFTYKDVRDNPRLCQQAIQQLVGRLLVDSNASIGRLTLLDREIVRLVLGRSRPVTITDVSTHVHLKQHATIHHLKRLCQEHWLEPASGAKRIRSYQIHPTRSNLHL